MGGNRVLLEVNFWVSGAESDFGVGCQVKHNFVWVCFSFLRPVGFRSLPFMKVRFGLSSQLFNVL